MRDTHEQSSSTRLTEVCWPVLEFVINFTRQVKSGTVSPPDQVRYDALSALREAEDLARNDPVAERAWNDRVRAMMVYLIDYKMLNTDWAGRNYWFDHRFETDADVLREIEALGGEKFFENCEEVYKEYEIAERRDRRDKDELAEVLSLYFICLRLGFKGKYHDYPQELADYTRRLFSRLPAYATTRAKEMFPDAYRHNEELKVDYRLGTSLAMVLIVFAVIVGVSAITFRVAWSSAVGEINRQSVRMEVIQGGSSPGEAANVGATAPAAPGGVRP